MPPKIFENLLERLLPNAEMAQEPVNDLANLVRLNRDLIDKEELSADDLTRLRQTYAAAKEAIGTLTADPAKVPEGFRHHIPALKAVQAPLEYFINAFDQSPKTLGQVLSDPGWLEGYLGSPEAVKEDISYVPGSFSIEGLDMAGAVELYRQQLAKAKQSFTEHLQRLSKDTEDPENVLYEKLQVIDLYIASCEEAPRTVDFTDMARTGFEKVSAAFDAGKVDTLDGSMGKIATQTFFDTYLGKFYDYTIVSGDIAAAKGISPEAKKLLTAEAKKLRLKTSYLGMIRKDVDMLVEASKAAGLFENYIRLLYENYPEGYARRDDGPVQVAQGHPLYDIITSLREKADKILDVLHGVPEASVPSEDEIMELTELMKDFVQKQPLFHEDGSYNDCLKVMAELAKRLAPYYPKLSNTHEEMEKAIKDRGEKEYMALSEALGAHPGRAETRAIKDRLRELRRSGTVTRAMAEKCRFVSMAMDPDQCAAQIQSAKEALSDHARFKGSNYRNFTEFSLTWNGFYNTGDIVLTEPEMRREICRIILVGSIMERQRQMGVEIGDVQEYLKQFERIDDNPAAKKLYEMDPGRLLAAVNDEAALSKAVDDMIVNKNAKIFPISADIRKALTQTSGNLYSSNSDEYEDMKTAIETIDRKNKTIGGASVRDYTTLVKSACTYMTQRSSEALSSNGQKRFAAAAQVVRTMGPKAALLVSDEERERILTSMVVNMFRSKDFRKEAVKDARNRIADIFGGSDAITAEKYSALSEAEKKSVKQDVRLLSAAESVEMSLKTVKKDQIYTQKDIGEKDLKSLRSFAKDFLLTKMTEPRLAIEPASYLKTLVCGKPAAKEPEKTAEKVPGLEK